VDNFSHLAILIAEQHTAPRLRICASSPRGLFAGLRAGALCQGRETNPPDDDPLKISSIRTSPDLGPRVTNHPHIL